MRYAILGALLRVAAFLQAEPERSALADFGRDLAALERAQRRPSSS